MPIDQSKLCLGAGELAHQLKALTVDPDSSPSTCTMAHNQLQLLFQGIGCSFLVPFIYMACKWCTDRQKKMPTCIKFFKIKAGSTGWLKSSFMNWDVYYPYGSD